MKEQRKSIYKRASEWGIPFGLYLACAGIASVFADWFQPLSFIFILMVLCTPLLVYYFQRRQFIEEDGFTEYAALWMLGILLFILGTILASFIMYLVIQYARPDFIYDQANGVIQAYKDIPEMRDSEFLRVLQRMIDERLLPAPIEMVFNAFWLITSCGCITSALTALVARRSIDRHKRQ